MRVLKIGFSAVGKFSGYGNHNFYKNWSKLTRYYRTTSCLTAVSKNNVERGKYARITPEDVSCFEGMLDKSRVVTDASELEPYNVDWMKSYHGETRSMLYY